MRHACFVAARSLTVAVRKGPGPLPVRKGQRVGLEVSHPTQYHSGDTNPDGVTLALQIPS